MLLSVVSQSAYCRTGQLVVAAEGLAENQRCQNSTVLMVLTSHKAYLGDTMAQRQTVYQTQWAEHTL